MGSSKKVLVGIATNGIGGVDSYIRSFCRVAHEEGWSCDAISTNPSKKFGEELAEFGCQLIEISNLHDKSALTEKILKLAKNNNYTGAYMNVSTAIMYPYVEACYKAQIPNIVVHAHAHYNSQSSAIKMFIFDTAHKYYKRKLAKLPVTIAGCSAKSAEWIGGSARITQGDWVFVPNPIDLEACMFNAEVRKQKRAELVSELGVSLDGKTIIGTATAFMPYKNPLFLIDVFAEYLHLNPDAYLLYPADGPMKDQVTAHAKKLLPNDKYKLLGYRTDIPELMQAYDAFVLPSLNEGLGMCLLEAQAAALPCVMSTAIPEEATAVPELANKVSLHDGAAAWAEALEKAIKQAPTRTAKFAEQVNAAGFNLNSPSKILPYLTGKK